MRYMVSKSLIVGETTYSVPVNREEIYKDVLTVSIGISGTQALSQGLEVLTDWELTGDSVIINQSGIQKVEDILSEYSEVEYIYIFVDNSVDIALGGQDIPNEPENLVFNLNEELKRRDLQDLKLKEQIDKFQVLIGPTDASYRSIYDLEVDALNPDNLPVGTPITVTMNESGSLVTKKMDGSLFDVDQQAFVQDSVPDEVAETDGTPIQLLGTVGALPGLSSLWIDFYLTPDSDYPESTDALIVRLPGVDIFRDGYQIAGSNKVLFQVVDFFEAGASTRISYKLTVGADSVIQVYKDFKNVVQETVTTDGLWFGTHLFNYNSGIAVFLYLYAQISDVKFYFNKPSYTLQQPLKATVETYYGFISNTTETGVKVTVHPGAKVEGFTGLVPNQLYSIDSNGDLVVSSVNPIMISESDTVGRLL